MTRSLMVRHMFVLRRYGDDVLIEVDDHKVAQADVARLTDQLNHDDSA